MPTRLLVVGEDWDVAIARGVAVVSGNGAEAIQQIFDAGIRRGDVVLAQLSEKAVGFISSGERHDDVAAQFVIETELQGVGEHAGRTGVRGLGDELLGIEMDVEQAGRPPRQPGAIGGTLDGADRRIVEALLDITSAEFARYQIGQSDRESRQRPIPLRIQGVAGDAADVALIALHAAEPAEGGRERVVDPAMKRIESARRGRPG